LDQTKEKGEKEGRVGSEEGKKSLEFQKEDHKPNGMNNLYEGGPSQEREKRDGYLR